MCARTHPRVCVAVSRIRHAGEQGYSECSVWRACFDVLVLGAGHILPAATAARTGAGHRLCRHSVELRWPISFRALRVPLHHPPVLREYELPAHPRVSTFTRPQRPHTRQHITHARARAASILWAQPSVWRAASRGAHRRDARSLAACRGRRCRLRPRAARGGARHAPFGRSRDCGEVGGGARMCQRLGD